MHVGVEKNQFIGVPVPEGVDRPGLDALFRFRELSDGGVEVFHPFHNTVRLGDASTIEDKSLDAAATVLFREMPFLIDSMKLNRPRQFETRPYAGEYSQLSHCFSLGILAVEFGGGPMDVLDGLFNDASHIYNGHQGDDNYQGHGQEDLHDKERAMFFERAGIIDALIDAGAFRRDASGVYVGKTRLTIDQLLSEDEVTIRRTFLSNKHASRRDDADRRQYREEERYLMGWAAAQHMPDPGRVPKALADTSWNSAARMIILEGDEGDQLVDRDPQAALSSAMAYVDHNAEHWCEPVQDLVNDILNLAERYFFVCDHPTAREYQYFYPRDYLHTSSSLMFKRFYEVAKDDPVMQWLLDTAERIATDQRAKSLSYLRSQTTYAGPNPPDGVELQKLPPQTAGGVAAVADGKFTISLPAGKMRTLNSRVLNGGGKTKPLSEIYPDFIKYCHEKNCWIGEYRATVEIGDEALVPLIADALKRINTEWSQQLNARPHMPSSELRRTIEEANQYVRVAGKMVIGR